MNMVITSIQESSSPGWLHTEMSKDSISGCAILLASSEIDLYTFILNGVLNPSVSGGKHSPNSLGLCRDIARLSGECSSSWVTMSDLPVT